MKTRLAGMKGEIEAAGNLQTFSKYFKTTYQ